MEESVGNLFAELSGEKHGRFRSKKIPATMLTADSAATLIDRSMLTHTYGTLTTLPETVAAGHRQGSPRCHQSSQTQWQNSDQ